MAARSKAWVCSRSLAGLSVSNIAGSWMSVCCIYCVLSGEFSASGYSLIQRSPNQCDVSKCDREASTVRKPWPTGGCLAMYKNYLNTEYPQVCSPKTVWSSVWFQNKATSFNLWSSAIALWVAHWAWRISLRTSGVHSVRNLQRKLVYKLLLTGWLNLGFSLRLVGFN